MIFKARYNAATIINSCRYFIEAVFAHRKIVNCQVKIAGHILKFGR